MSITLDAPSVEPNRDRWGRPLITPPGGGKAIAYTRVSTLAKTLDSKDALMMWKQRMTAIGLGKRPDLAQLAGVTDPSDKRALNDIVKNAMAAAESDRAANIGTTLHSITEATDLGHTVEVPTDMVDDIRAYSEATRSLTMKAAERFVVCDELQAAGTFDRLAVLPDGTIVIGDLKTGQSEPDYPHGVATQCAIYARSHLYDASTNTRGAYLPDLGVSTDIGLLIHLPAGQGVCNLYVLDLNVGWQLAKAAAAVRTIYKSKPITPYP